MTPTTQTMILFLAIALAIPPLATASIVDDLASPTASGQCSGNGYCAFSCAPFAELYVSGSSWSNVWVPGPPDKPWAGYWNTEYYPITVIADCGHARVQCNGSGGCATSSGEVRTIEGQTDGACIIQGAGENTGGSCLAYGGTGPFHSACGQTLGAEYDDAHMRPGDADGVFDATYEACVWLVTNDSPPPPAVRT